MKRFVKLFVQTDDEQNVDSSSVASYESSDQIGSVQGTVEISEDVLMPEQIFAKAEIDNPFSIYDVTEFLDGLPADWDSITKKKTLLKMLRAAKYDIDVLNEDAAEKIQTLNDYKVASADDLAAKTDKVTSQIEELRAAIAGLESDLAISKANHGQQVRLIDDEVSKLNTLGHYVTESGDA